MGSNDIPPPHVPAHVVPVCNLFLQIGGALWTLCYMFLARESLRSKSYGMPLFALALNFAWELVYALYVAESPLEQFVFSVWLVIDCSMVYGLVQYGKHEWGHSPFIARNIGKVFAVLAILSIAGHWSFAKWWIDNGIGRREGKIYRGTVGPDTTELGFWSAAVCQAYLSAASLCQLLCRNHSGGVSWKVWITRTLGSVIGFYMVYGWEWYFWPEAHEYVVSPFAIFLLATSLVSDIVYGIVLHNVRKSEIVAEDGRKFSGDGSTGTNAKEKLR